MGGVLNTRHVVVRQLPGLLLADSTSLPSLLTHSRLTPNSLGIYHLKPYLLRLTADLARIFCWEAKQNDEQVSQFGQFSNGRSCRPSRYPPARVNTPNTPTPPAPSRPLRKYSKTTPSQRRTGPFLPQNHATNALNGVFRPANIAFGG